MHSVEWTDETTGTVYIIEYSVYRDIDEEEDYFECEIDWIASSAINYDYLSQADQYMLIRSHDLQKVVDNHYALEGCLI